MPYFQPRLTALCVAFCSISLYFSVYAAIPLDLNSATDAQALTRERINQEVMIRGVVASVKESTGENDPLLLSLTPQGSAQNVVIGYLPAKFQEFHGTLGTPKVGTHVVVRGKVWDYQGSLLVKPTELADIMLEGYAHTYQIPDKVTTLVSASQPTSQPAVQASPVSDKEPQIQSSSPSPQESGIKNLTIQDFPTFLNILNEEVQFTGKVEKFKPFWSPRAPNIIYVGKGNETLEIVYWDTEEKLDAKLRTPGEEIVVLGALQNYNGKLQLKVEQLENIKLK